MNWVLPPIFTEEYINGVSPPYEAPKMDLRFSMCNILDKYKDDGLHHSSKIAAFDFDQCLAKTSLRRSFYVGDATHGPNWLVGRSGITRRTKKSLAINNDSKELGRIREELSAEMEEKMNKKLKRILGKIAEENPTLKIKVEELCDKSVDDGDKADEKDA